SRDQAGGLVEVAGALLELTCEHVRPGVAVFEAPAVERGAGLDQRRAAAEVAGVELRDQLQQGFDERDERSLARRPRAQVLDELPEIGIGGPEDQRLLRREVAEEGARGDVGSGGDLVDRRRLEALLLIQCERSFLDRGPRLTLLPLAESFL